MLAIRNMPCLPGYLIYVLLCVYAINGARGFWPGFWQGFVILSIMNLIDRFLIDDEFLFTGDAIALNRDGGWCFFDIFN